VQKKHFPNIFGEKPHYFNKNFDGKPEEKCPPVE
jgi:hypothetical protein